MTMHLLGHQYSTINTRKKKQKITDSDRRRLEKEWVEHNRYLRQNHLPKVSFDEYVEISFGRKKVTIQKRGAEKKPLTGQKAYRRDQDLPVYRSADDSKVSTIAAKQESQKYSGERKMLGVATMHKSSMVPVFEEADTGNQYAKDLANMRR